MKHVSILLLFLVACGSQKNAADSQSHLDGGINPDAGNDGGADAGLPDAGTDGGIDGGTDGGTVCVNTVEEVPYVAPQDCRIHIPEDETPVYRINPPVAGPHYPVWAAYQVYDTPLTRGYWVHNLEHGAVVFLYRPDAPRTLIDALIRVYGSIPLEEDCVAEGFLHNRTILTPDPLLNSAWAVTVSGPESEYCVGSGYRIKADCIASVSFLVDFAVQHRNMSIESICDDGIIP
jgi:hypothetical protein